MRRQLLPLALVLLALPGCSAALTDTRAAYDPTTDLTEGRPLLAELPPAAGEVIAVLQNQARGILTQRIVLRGDRDTVGENAIVVKVDRSPQRRPADVEGPVEPPNRAMIAAEIDETFAGVDMGLSDTFARNSFGPFGYAVGHPNPRVTCIYAWQWGLAKPRSLIGGADGAPSMPADPTSVRVRLCRSTLGEAEMASLLRSLQVFRPDSHEAYLDPEYAGAGDTKGDALAAAGVGYFVGPNVARTPLHDKPRHAHKHAHRHVARAREAPEAFDPPLRGGVAVPLPGGPAAAPAANPLLAPLAATAPAPRAPADDMPLPARAAPAERPAAPAASSASIPLPN